MNTGAGVTSLDALNEWYAALAEFRTDAQNALTALALALQRADDWLGEQQQYWQRQIRVCEEAVVEAKAELTNRRHADFSGRVPDCTVQEKNLRLAEARLEFAEERLEAVRRWMKHLTLEIRDTFDGPSRHLALFLEADLPRGLALLARQLTALEQYANLRADVAAPAAGPPKENP